MTPGQLIKKHRTQKGLTQIQLAKQLGYEIPQFISLMENGHSKVPLSLCKMLVVILKINNSILSRSLVNEYKNEVKKACGVK